MLKNRLKKIIPEGFAEKIRPYYRQRTVLKLSNIIKSMLVVLSPNYLTAYWARGGVSNFGDNLSPVLMEMLSGKRVVHCNDIYNLTNKPTYFAVGSILDKVKRDNSVIWGSGFIRETDRLKVKPSNICAVRGPYTRSIILKSGVPCPEIYGDPGLLCPLFFAPTSEKRYEIGLVPHFVDIQSAEVMKFGKDPLIKTINITDDIESLIQQINECKVIVSSSLHGIIIADAYKIPSKWIVFSDNVTGNGFKFKDYFASVGKIKQKPIMSNKVNNGRQLISEIDEETINIDLDLLLSVSPFGTKCQPLKCANE